MNRTAIRFLALLALTFSCAKGSVTNTTEADKKINTQTDPNNCGKKNNVCINRDKGVCFEGYCRCNSNKDCHWPATCRDGICQAQVASGAMCWIDEDCEAKQYCISGHCAPRVCLTEICDGYDNNCDGQIDESAALDRFCYSGPLVTFGVGACHGGKQICSEGKYTTCIGEVTPHAEVGRWACDKEDSDCDGCVDGIGNATLGCMRAAPPLVDICFMVDNSGSMSDRVDACKMTIATFVKYKNNPRFRFCLISVSYSGVTGFVKVLQPLTDFDTFLTALNAVGKDGDGTEPTYDAVYLTASGAFDAEINFRPGSLPVYIVFGDEDAQSVRMPSISEADACGAVDARGVLLSVITEPSVFSDWDRCAAKYTFPLSSDPAEMFTSLDSILSLPCFED